MRKLEPVGKDAYHVVGAQPEVIRPAAAHALTVAQRLAERASEPVVLTIERRTLFGPGVLMYRVTRDKDGKVYTNTINPQD